MRELIGRHLAEGSTLHANGVPLNPVHVPPGTTVREGALDGQVTAGDLVLVEVDAGPGLADRVPRDLPSGVTVAVLVRSQVAELPVGRLVSAVTSADLQVLEAAAMANTTAPSVAVVARRSEDLVLPTPPVARDLEPTTSSAPESAVRRLLGEHVVEGLVARARERAVLAQVGAVEAELAEATEELERLRRDLADHDRVMAERAGMEADLRQTRRELDTERKRLAMVRTSTTFRLASVLARASGAAKRVARRPGR